MNNFMLIITNIITLFKSIIYKNYYYDRMQIINKYYLHRLFINFMDESSPKHYIDLSIENIVDPNVLYVCQIVYKLNENLHGTSKYKLLVKNKSESGKRSFKSTKEAIITGLFIIDNRNTKNINYKINIFIKYLINSLIEMFRSITNFSEHQNIINNIYFLLKNKSDQQITLKQKVDEIQLILSSLNRNNDDKIKLELIYSILVIIK